MHEIPNCYWVLYHKCRFSKYRNTTPKKEFCDEYCAFCLQGQKIKILSDFAHKFDNI